MIEKYQQIYEELYRNGYHKDYGFTHSRNLVKKIIKYVPIGSRILDIGSSNGTCMSLLTASGYQAFGIDVSETANNLAKNNGAKNAFIGSVTAIPFSNEFFSVLTSSDVLEHIMPQDVDIAIQEMNRVVSNMVFLKIFTAPEQNKEWVTLLKNKDMNIDNLHLTILPTAEWVNKFLLYGFRILDIEHPYPNTFEIILQKKNAFNSNI